MWYDLYDFYISRTDPKDSFGRLGSFRGIDPFQGLGSFGRIASFGELGSFGKAPTLSSGELEIAPRRHRASSRRSFPSSNT
jgi:hypothetical protein